MPRNDFHVYVDKYCYFFASTELQDSTLGILRSGPTLELEETRSQSCFTKTLFQILRTNIVEERELLDCWN